MSYENLLAHEVPEFLGQSDAVVLDMRDTHSFELGHIEGAKPASDQVIKRLLRDKRRDRPILVYCYHGNSSRDLATFISGLGFTRVSHLEGGWQAWSNFQSRNQATFPESLKAWAIECGFDPANINGRIKNGMSPLMVASMQSQADIVKTLLDAGADVGLTNDDGNNALWFACYSGDLAVVQALISHGVDIDNQNVNGATCLIYAASAGKLEVVQALVDAGADLYATTPDGFNALDSAATLPILRLLKSRYAQGESLGL